ncbi:MAG TPA: CTP--2,3-di-O-geranylgeranyl-sn-glycero-1-phosphate cytidyltransferase [Candidatus Nanoarchaeia archaeon]|nr:CTP--2,3-di-O-geranylgeranyl-sn-glycero-1-phosphate cytidyltransferase [Candidatus Nanoarchaeia archaeon]
MDWLLFKEFKRKIFHIFILLAIIAYAILNHFFGKQIALMALVGLLVLFLLEEYLRLDLGLKFFSFEHIIKSKERERYYGIIYFLAATIISLSVFDFRIALAALLMTALGDMTATFMGKIFGKTTIFRTKTLAGTLFELVTNLIIGFAVLSNVYIIIAMAFIATFVETFVDELDDNLLIPLFAGFAGQLLFFLL